MSSSKRGGGDGVAGSKPISTAEQYRTQYTWSPNKLRRSNSIFNLWYDLSQKYTVQKNLETYCTLKDLRDPDPASQFFFQNLKMF
jgi:hypothetical protein